MEQQEEDSGLQFVLDNRRLILGFGMLILLCGAFFVLGFVEGKRQGSSSAPTARGPGSLAGPTSAASQPSGAPSVSGKDAADAKAVQGRLDWYNRVGSSKGGSARAAEPKAPSPGKAGGSRETSAGSSSAAAPPASAGMPAAKTVYSVQVGAFRQRKEAEAKGAMLKAKGYDFIIEPPRPPDEFFLLKVGRFETRAEAAAMQLRLRKDGFPNFIKSD